MMSNQFFLFKSVLAFLGMTVLFSGCSETPIPVENIDRNERQLAEWVDPFIGTGGHGHTYPGATRPFGLVQLSPDTRLDGWDGCSAYHYTDSMIYGFSHTHLQGTGVSDYGDILLMPTNNSVNSGNNWSERYRSSFRKETEQAHAGYYTVHLDDHNITAELTATTRVGIHRYTFDEPDSCVVFMDMEHRDELISYQFEPQGDSMIIGFRRSHAWAEDQHVYFVAHFSEPFEYLDQTYEVYYEQNPETGVMTQVFENVGVFPLRFGVIDTLEVHVALSSVSIEGALKNLAEEAPTFGFSRYRADAEQAWNESLAAIEIEAATEDDYTVFYTALYHTLTVPNTWSDVDGHYRGMDQQVHQLSENRKAAYTVFSLWDTFRAAHPLYTLIQRERTQDFVGSMLDMYRQSGALPVWELAANETGCMIGYHSVSVILDAYMKGIGDWDHSLALQAMIETAKADELGKKPFAELGYIPSELEHESVSKTLEYAYNDWCIARFAEAMGSSDAVVAKFDQRALAYRNLFNPKTGFIQPRRGASFIENYDPTEVNFNYTEANGWQYNFFMPHDINGHIRLLGGDEAYIAKLDEMFFGSSEISGRDQADITGLIGQYAHGNEPSHHMAYLYAYAGAPYRTQELVHKIMSELYTAQPDGLSGNEDCGQMSAWYVLSALGIYPVTPGSTVYVFGTPRFDASINFEDGKTLDIRVKRPNKDAIYIQNITLDGAPFTKSYIHHYQLAQGGTLVFELGNTPSSFGTEVADRPVAETHSEQFVPSPTVIAPRTFRDSVEVELVISDPDFPISYALHDANGQGNIYKSYTAPFYLHETTTVRPQSRSQNDEWNSSSQVSSTLTKIDHSRTVQVTPAYDPQYAAGGDNALIDGIRGGPNFKTGDWQGFYEADTVTVTVDLGEVKMVSAMSLGAIQDIRPWIWAPSEVIFAFSLDGVDFKPVDKVMGVLDIDDYTPEVYRYRSLKSGKARFVRARVVTIGAIPEWHLGYGNRSWVFLDEFQISTL